MKTAEDEANASNYAVFRDCLSEVVIHRLAPSKPATKDKKKKRASAQLDNLTGEIPDLPGSSSDAEELGDFIEYLAGEIFPVLPKELAGLSYAAVKNDPSLSAAYEPPLPASTLETVSSALPSSAIDSLTAYGLLSDSQDVKFAILAPLLTAYARAVAAPPPPLDLSARATACEICERDWIPLTYHHLIPRQVHDKVLKRGWHEEWRLNAVAWLCRACHSMVHRVASNEELARQWYSVELLLQREDVQGFARWVSKVRWRSR